VPGSPIVQGDQDRVMPPGATAITRTHAVEINRALLGFLRAL
jgi:hypothetical protein